MCPKGDMDTLLVEVVIRDCDGNPLPAESVTVYLAPQGMCASNPVVVTDSEGWAAARIGRTTGCGYAIAHADCRGVTISSELFYIANFSLELDCKVDLADFAIFAAYYASTNPCADYDCSGLVDLTDFAKFAGHYGHP
jgi:hypothetical protein